jgi:hypothetical protein
MTRETVKPNILRFTIALGMSFVFAVASYDILLFFALTPFASFYRMYVYHLSHPYQFIFIMCFVFSVLAALFCEKFKKLTPWKQILLTLLIVVLTIIISSPLGGMLWHLHDMLAGYFPKKWLWKLIRYGFREGIQLGWVIILLSAPYNILGVVMSFFIMRTVSKFPRKQ